MADKITQLQLDALAKAALAAAGSPLHATKATPGLFPATASGKAAAQKARDDGLIDAVAADPKRELFAATPKGLAFLTEHTSPKQVLDDLARAVEARQTQVADLIVAARTMGRELTAIQALLFRLGELSAPSWLDAARTYLRDWSSPEDCPLPTLYRTLIEQHPTLSVGEFHDGLRRLHDTDEVYLHPWTGPLYALPEPTLALLSGHEIAYYASTRNEPGSRGERPHGSSIHFSPAPLLPCSPAH